MLLIRYFAGARAAAGVPEEKVAAATLDELIRVLAARGDALARVLRVASYLVNGTAWHDRAAPLPTDATIDVLPPFAGG